MGRFVRYNPVIVTSNQYNNGLDLYRSTLPFPKYISTRTFVYIPCLSKNNGQRSLELNTDKLQSLSPYSK
jgi:hypothetical protein